MNIFSQPVGFFLNSLINAFHMENVLILIKPNYAFFPFMDCLFCVMSLYSSFVFLCQLSFSTLSFTSMLWMLQTLILFVRRLWLLLCFQSFSFYCSDWITYWSIFKFAAFPSFISILLLSLFNEFFPSVILYLSFKISHSVLSYT